MADLKITDMTELTAAATTDLLCVVDVSDPGTGTTKKITILNLMDPLVVGKSLSMRPAFVAGKTTSPQKPTPVFLGAWGVYSMPIYASDNEELFWRCFVPGRWDGTSNVTYNLVCAISDAETENDDFAIQLSWASNIPGTGAISASTTDLTSYGECTSGHTAQYSTFKLTFTIDYTVPNPDLAAGDVLAGRVRRVAVGGGRTEVDNEIYILDHWLTFTVDKIYKV